MIELVVVFALFSMLGLIAYTAMTRSADIYRRTSSRTSAQRELRRAEVRIEHDLRATSYDSTATSGGPASLGTAPDGDALWMLSAFSPKTQRYMQSEDGGPYWQSHVLYYLAVPGGHTGCSGGAGPDGNDDRCPHKVLIRKIIDMGDPADPTPTPGPTPKDELEDPEVLANSMNAFTTPPVGISTAGMVGGEVIDAQIVAINLLGFKVTRGAGPKEIQVDLRAVAIDEAQRKLGVGTTSLFSVPYTLVQQLTIIPNDP